MGVTNFFPVSRCSAGQKKVGAGPAQRAGKRKTLHSHGTTFSFPRPGRRLTIDQLSCSHDLGVVFPGCGSFSHDLGAVFPGCGAFRQAFHFEPNIERAAGRTANGRESGTVSVQELPPSLCQDRANARFSRRAHQLFPVPQCGVRTLPSHPPDRNPGRRRQRAAVGAKSAARSLVARHAEQPTSKRYALRAHRAPLSPPPGMSHRGEQCVRCVRSVRKPDGIPVVRCPQNKTKPCVWNSCSRTPVVA